MASDQERDKLYSRINAVYRNSPRADTRIVIVMGDLNARVGTEHSAVEYVAGQHDVGCRNRYVGRFVDFCSGHHLVSGRTIFQHCTRDKVT